MSTPEASPEQLRRPLAGTERGWLLAVPGGTGVSVAALLLPSTTPLDALARSLTSVVARHPILGALLNEQRKFHPPFFSFPASATTVDISTDARGHPSFSHLEDVVEFEMNRNPWACAASARQQPVLFASLHTLCPPEQSRSVLCVKIHTAVCDRAGAVRVLKEVMSSAVGGGAKEDAAGLSAGIDGMIPEKDARKPLWSRGVDLVGYSINGFRTATLGFASAARPDCSRVLRLALGRADTENLLSACKERGVKLCAAMAAATLLAVRRSKHKLEASQKESYSVITLINCRTHLEPALDEHNLGFFHSAVTSVHSVGGKDGLWELAKRCQASCSGAVSNKKHLTDIADLRLLMFKAIANPQLTPSGSLRTAVVSVFEEPAVYDSHLGGGLGAEDYVACSSVHGIGPSIAVFDAIRNGRLDCVWVYPSPLHSRPQMEAIMQQVKAMLVDGSGGA